MSFIKTTGVVMVLVAAFSVVSAYAQGRIFTASIDEKGTVTAQSSRWLKEVTLTAQPDYFSEYKVRFVPGVFKQAPRFCTVSVTDVSSNEHVFYGHAKLGGLPKINYVNVLTLKVGDNKPAGDSSMGFMLMCVE
ncbi:hypothetical protein K7402_28385 [Pseudomonas fluorescens group sp.]|uniref:Uncharacterized protein n=1 Tax=Pseudomonas fluorescens TaxID=294 RepID=A0ACD4XRW1_PSEFL|nr:MULTISPECIES: hypothetical protein [Pseudomonas fluorescens group]MBZ6457603.1 hypothetical protein [Pseudomonas fluorescens group sp.]MBZ6460877.1 hypothetical protein [Pseudomonas fluorescens group sp.]MBZ6471319.1 hypothetical protein [Pseudomonas fluorescens group sp.]WQD71960.1 hypothetical protein U0037_28655 [Pseudomonas marginalis]